MNNIQSLITQAQSLKHDLTGLLCIVADIINISNMSVNNLSLLPELGSWFSHLAGATDFLTYSAQTMHQIQNSVAIL